jgi:GDP-4-dehydro-6-deoxy-D-mannose reductase
MNEQQAPTILITGGTGFAGSHLVELLLESYSAENIHVTSYSSKTTIVDSLLAPQNIHQLNLRDVAATKSLIAAIKPDQIYHLAAIAQVGGSFGKAAEVFTNNFQLQFSLLEAVKETAPKSKVLIVGSAQEYDVITAAKQNKQVLLDENAPLGPSNPYGVSKVTQDLLALSYFYSYQLSIVRVRPFNHIGERQSLGFAVADFAQQIVAVERGDQTEIKVGNLEAERDFTDVKDMVSAYKIVMEKGKLGEAYNIGSGKGVSIQFILDSLVSLSDAAVLVVVDSTKLRPLDVKSIVANTEKIQSLGWKPEIPLDTTLQRVLDYWRSQS